LGALAPVRDFNFVADTVEGFLAAAASPKTVGEVVNVGSGRGVTVRETAELIMRLTGRHASLRLDPRRMRPAKSEVGKLLCDNGKARRLFGFKPRFSLEEGLVHAVNYCQARLGKYKVGMYNR
jgi:dTDP-glucose 4,6-dehydratase